MKQQYVFLIGAKSPGAYGGYETFVDRLTEYHQNDGRLVYYAACKANGEGSIQPSQLKGAKQLTDKLFIYHGARCFRINVPEKLGPAKAVVYDLASLKKAIDIIKRKRIRNAVVYIMACRIGPFLAPYCRKLHRLGAKLYINPDGHEWKRAKWSAPVRRYWKLSEGLMVKQADLVICDSVNIEKYIHESYDRRGSGGSSPKTVYIAYGADTARSSTYTAERVGSWLKEHGLEANGYYLIVGRFVPENNYETMLREFMASHTDKALVVITNQNSSFYEELEDKLHFSADSRIHFVGTVYDKELLKGIRERAYAYLHGHEVGGTNPSLLEALASTELNLLLGVGFNREVALDAALYWSKKKGSLSSLIDRSDALPPREREKLGAKAVTRIKEKYSWEYICDRYAAVFLGEINNDMQ
ncbi:beta 1-4 rhamnosyltransferase Cps2T [uncultured Ruminococcus sp.]|uniref:beta 1-4 rhamnosyltransferase Cps2T n=1 Tax=uncultured Ruminococcus sp. TaxID=165186 RepID=UPI002628D4E3|nr:DUF1972 domain-containing protein [uncultured Ruminococcus sp.]